MKISMVISVFLISLFLIITIACQEKKAEDQKTLKQHESVSKHQCDNIKKQAQESGTELALNEQYDMIRNGARLVLTYDAGSNSFIGTIENTTEKKLENVRIAVHLSNGIELGPTAPVNLNPGRKMIIKLTATSERFKSWTAHPEIGREEDGHGGEHGEESSEEH